MLVILLFLGHLSALGYPPFLAVPIGDLALNLLLCSFFLEQRRRSSQFASMRASATASVPSAVASDSEAGGASLTAFERGTIEVFVGLARAVGLPRSYGEIYGLLYASAEPLAFGDIQARLGLSKGSVSQGLKALRAVGAVRLALPEGDNGTRDRFGPETELRRLVGGFLHESLRPHLEDSDRRLVALRAQLVAEPAPAARKKILQARHDKLVRWHKQGRAVLPWLEKFLG
jgi:DNA-binding transcriptional regulator GbsR (MarR family)